VVVVGVCTAVVSSVVVVCVVVERSLSSSAQPPIVNTAAAANTQEIVDGFFIDNCQIEPAVGDARIYFKAGRPNRRRGASRFFNRYD
jgi:hypothetical protein